MNRRALATLVITAVLFTVTGLFIATRIEVSTGLGHFLSGLDQFDLATVSARQMVSPATRSMVLFVRGSDLPNALEAARRWGKILEHHGEIETLRLGPDPTLNDAVHDLYFPRRYSFLTHAPEATPPVLRAPAGLERAARRLRLELTSPRAPLIKEIAGADPLLAFPDLLERFRKQAQGDVEIVDGQFAAPQAKAAAIILTTRHSAFASNHQGPLEDFIQRSFAELQAQFPTPLKLERSGVHRFAVASERQGIAEMQWMSSISMVGIAVLFLLLLRSPRLLAVAILPLAAGVLLATAASILIFGEIHLMTLVFGSTLIGVCIDYPVHCICHHTLLPDPAGPKASILRVWPAISMGAFTTMAGFTGLAQSDFPGIRELGLFAAIGVLASLLATRAILPNLIPAMPAPSTAQRRAARMLARGFAALRRSRAGARSGLTAAVLLICAGVPFVTWDDDVFSLNMPINLAWAEEDRSVRHWFSAMDLGRFVVAIANDEEQALVLNDAVYARLIEAQTDGLIEGFRSLHSFLPSKLLQEQSFAALQSAPDLAARYLDALEAEGFRRDAFGAFEDALASPAPSALRFADLDATPLGPLVAPFRVELEERVGLLTFLKGAGDPEQLEAALADLPGVHYFDQQSFVADLYAGYRTRVTLLVAAGLAVVALLLFIRFRSLHDAVAALAPALTAAGATLAILALSGSSINLLHILGLLLVLSIGVDYAIFLVSSRHSSEDQTATLLSLCIACASTCLSFGLLSLSAFPALRALGLTTGLGTLLSLVLAPIIFTLMESRGEPA